MGTLRSSARIAGPRRLRRPSPTRAPCKPCKPCSLLALRRRENFNYDARTWRCAAIPHWCRRSHAPDSRLARFLVMSLNPPYCVHLLLYGAGRKGRRFGPSASAEEAVARAACGGSGHGLLRAACCGHGLLRAACCGKCFACSLSAAHSTRVLMVAWAGG